MSHISVCLAKKRRVRVKGIPANKPKLLPDDGWKHQASCNSSEVHGRTHTLGSPQAALSPPFQTGHLRCGVSLAGRRCQAIQGWKRKFSPALWGPGHSLPLLCQHRQLGFSSARHAWAAASFWRTCKCVGEKKPQSLEEQSVLCGLNNQMCPLFAESHHFPFP